MARERLKLVAKGREHLASSPLDRAYGYEVNWRNVSALFEIARGYRHPSFVYFIGGGYIISKTRGKNGRGDLHSRR